MRTAHLVTHLNPSNQGYNQIIQQYQQALLSTGQAAATTLTTATGQVYQQLRIQVQVTAYSDVFMFCAVSAFAVVPVAFLFSGVKATGGGGGHEACPYSAGCIACSTGAAARAGRATRSQAA